MWTGPHKITITKGVLTMYTIGQMSQLCHISARRLRYFEAMGILKPAMLSEKGYRYYQAAVRRLGL